MKNVLVALTTALSLALSAGLAMAADTVIEGTVSGYTCVTQGKACPVDREDPVIAAEKLFVVVKPDGVYYLVPNVDRAILARHLTEKVRVTGTAEPKYGAIQAKSLDVYLADKGTWKTVWSLAMEDEAQRWLDRGN